MKTIRQALADLLRQGEWSSIELSQELSIEEREIFPHLTHIQKSLRGEKLLVSPYTCQKCGYAFVKRTRLTRPGKCPQCKATHIRMALFSIAKK